MKLSIKPRKKTTLIPLLTTTRLVSCYSFLYLCLDHHILIFCSIKQILAEIVGTYIFVFAGCGAALVDRERPLLTFLGLAFVPALALMTMIYTVGHISGAHFNPAVSIAFAVTRKLPLIQVRSWLNQSSFASQCSRSVYAGF